MPLYNPALGLPPGLKLPDRVLLTLSMHARDKAARLGLRLPLNLSLCRCSLFEVETSYAGQVVKLGLRYSHDQRRDCCVVISDKGDSWQVVTCWLNEKNDNHRTLNPNRYHKPEETCAYA